jgi:hypothetical protein
MERNKRTPPEKSSSTTIDNTSDVFHGGQINIGSGALFTEGMLADDFAPASSEFLDGLEILGSEGLLRHVLSFLGVASNDGDELLSAMFTKTLAAAKGVLHPICTPATGSH